MRFLSKMIEPKSSLADNRKIFTNAMLKAMIVPLLIEQLLQMVVGLADTMIEGSGMVNSESYNDGVFSEIDAGSPLLVGRMSARDGSRKRAIFICPAGDPYDIGNLTFTLRFKSRRRVRITGGEGEITAARKCGGRYSLEIKPNQGILIETR